MRKIFYILWSMCTVWIVICCVYLVKGRQVQEYSVRLCIPERVYVEDGELSLLAKNSADSSTEVVLEIVTSQDNVGIARVELSPGQYVSHVPMLTILEEGEYVCYVNVYEASNLKYISKTSLLVVKE